MNTDELSLTEVARLWPAIKLIRDATEEQADAALKAFTEQFGKNEAIEALFQLGGMFRDEKTGTE